MLLISAAGFMLVFYLKEKVHHPRDTTVGNRLEKENLNGKLRFLCLSEH